ncbi:MAG: DegV family protein [Lachnospiraceae bacterium]|nr:DegV family protein [uncultured Acetatifactor sp.]MCI8286660.1 DegV family protein [Lachnospiraceae bacterium]
MYRIITDSTTDLPAEYFREHNVGCIPISYILDGITYGGEKELDWKEFYALMRNEGKMPTTSQINPVEAKTFLEKCAEKDREILYLAFSSGLSGTCGNMRMAAAELMEEHPDVKIMVVDSLGASMGEGLFVHKAVKMRDAGKTMEETTEWLEAHVQNFVHVFTVDDLFHLYRGGRVSRTAAVLGTMISIKPKLHVDSEGHLILIGKVRGRRKSLSALVDYMEEKMGDWVEENRSDYVFISHGDALEDAEYVRDLIREKFGIQHFIINHIGPTIGAHSGPGTIALFFMGESR